MRDKSLVPRAFSALLFKMAAGLAIINDFFSASVVIFHLLSRLDHLCLIQKTPAGFSCSWSREIENPLKDPGESGDEVGVTIVRNYWLLIGRMRAFYRV